MTKKEKLIYLAGIIDGEGCVRPIFRSNSKKTKFWYHPRCTVHNTSEDLIDWLIKNFGGKKTICKRDETRKISYLWNLRYAEMQEILPQLCPYLIVKKEETLITIKQLKDRLKNTQSRCARPA